MASRFLHKWPSTSATGAYLNRSNDVGMGLDTSDAKLKFHDGVSTVQKVVTEGQAQSLTNKTLTSPVINSAPIVLAAATLTLDPTIHDGKVVVVNRAAGTTITLPAATGSGARYQIFIGLLVTSTNVILQVGNASDYMRGFAYVKSDDSATSANTYITANSGTPSTESDTITWNRTTTGACIVGDYIEVIDIAANVWAVETENNATGTEATPFSAAV